MSKRCLFVLILYLFLFTTSRSMSLEASSLANNGSTKESHAAALQANMSSQQDLTSTENFTGVNNTAANLKYIWSVSGIEKDQITMALNQEGNDLFGKAKYEPENNEPWNGVVAGSVSENRVHLAIAAMKAR